MNRLSLITNLDLVSPGRVVEPLWWVGHIPFVMWLVENTKPQILVELGAHTGNSYFAMCHSVKANRLPTRCYAVDTWQGDLHQGAYEDDVYQSVKQYNNSHYSGFSELLRMTFDEALSKFGEGTIDLLHIDGFHTYEAARHDFETWLPKLSERAVVLFHDTAVRKLDFGVWRLWEELSAKYPNIHFEYSQGLGVLFIGERQPAAIHELLNNWATSEGKNEVHNLFASLGQSVEIASLYKVVANRDEQISVALKFQNELQLVSNELRNQIDALHSSTSWRITKPLREASRLRQRFIQLMRLFQNYRQRHQGFNGFKRLSSQCIDAIRKGGLKGLRNKLSLYEQIVHKIPMSAEAMALQCGAHQFDLLQTCFKKGLILNPTIIFDHNGGGGTNTYTQELVKIIRSEGGSVLRLYCFDSSWFVQWLKEEDGMSFYTSSIEELFEVLSLSHSVSIVLNSLYGFPDIALAISKIITLVKTLSATLDVKIHDFYALCPSPHLLNFEGKYCGVPQDLEKCGECIKKNHDWYHGWYPEKNKPVHIDEWRKPFSELFEAANSICVFDLSSVEIMRKAFTLDDSKIKVVPHDIDYFKCSKRVDVTGPLHIGVLGTLTKGKGGDVVNELHKYSLKEGLRVPISIVGTSLVALPAAINVWGNYTPNDLPEIIGSQCINIILMPSIVPETFSYTISEAMKMGLPIVAFDLGAQGNRVKQYELGKVIPLGSSPEAILAAIQSALKTAQELRK